jgi:membrane protease YdiL (CAAX protease family)
MNIFLNSKKQLREVWWVAIFFLILAALTFPLILLSQHYKWEITIAQQAIIVVATSVFCQLLRKQPFSELAGKCNLTWFRNFLLGLLAGALLMLLPALFLYLIGLVQWETGSINATSFLSATGTFAAVAVAEEFLFRGFFFQRLITSIGKWGAQLLVAGYFLLIHINNPVMHGNIRILASVNIFLASIMFGLVFIRTRSLAMPLALHFMANWTQGVLLGFGVSGNEQTSLVKPVFNDTREWLTGGSFGKEASLAGLITVITITVLLYAWKPQFANALKVNRKSKKEVKRNIHSHN